MLLGYARVSTDDQDLALQRRALREAGCRRLYEGSPHGLLKIARLRAFDRCLPFDPVLQEGYETNLL